MHMQPKCRQSSAGLSCFGSPTEPGGSWCTIMHGETGPANRKPHMDTSPCSQCATAKQLPRMQSASSVSCSTDNTWHRSGAARGPMTQAHPHPSQSAACSDGTSHQSCTLRTAAVGFRFQNRQAPRCRVELLITYGHSHQSHSTDNNTIKHPGCNCLAAHHHSSLTGLLPAALWSGGTCVPASHHSSKHISAVCSPWVRQLLHHSMSPQLAHRGFVCSPLGSPQQDTHIPTHADSALKLVSLLWRLEHTHYLVS